MQHVFGNIDKAKVTTGYLKEFGIRFNNIENYDGVLDTLNFVDKTQWQSLYSSLYSMRVGTVATNMTATNTCFYKFANPTKHNQHRCVIGNATLQLSAIQNQRTN